MRHGENLLDLCDYSVASEFAAVEAFVMEHHIDLGP
jgi:hypothetical protein